MLLEGTVFNLIKLFFTFANFVQCKLSISHANVLKISKWFYFTLIISAFSQLENKKKKRNIIKICFLLCKFEDLFGYFRRNRSHDNHC